MEKGLAAGRALFGWVPAFSSCIYIPCLPATRFSLKTVGIVAELCCELLRIKWSSKMTITVPPLRRCGEMMDVDNRKQNRSLNWFRHVISGRIFTSLGKQQQRGSARSSLSTPPQIATETHWPTFLNLSSGSYSTESMYVNKSGHGYPVMEFDTTDYHSQELNSPPST